MTPTVWNTEEFAIFDWKSFLDPHLVPQMSGHSKPRSFKFCMDPHTNEVQMFYKESVLAKQWRGVGLSYVDGKSAFLFFNF